VVHGSGETGAAQKSGRNSQFCELYFIKYRFVHQTSSSIMQDPTENRRLWETLQFQVNWLAVEGKKGDAI
jgi:hypothetical protein